RTPHHIGGGLHQHPHFPLHLDAGQHPEPPNAEQNRSRFDTVNHDLWPPLSAVSCNHQEKRGHGSHHGISRLTRRPFAPHSSRRAGFSEHYATKVIAELVESEGFVAHKGVFGLPTTLKATAGTGSPRVAFLAEYDALPEIGHACGHNV